MSASEEREIVLKIPVELTQYRKAVDAGLFYLSLDHAAPAGNAPAGECKSSRIKVSASAVNYLDRLTTRYGSRRQAIINALAWVAAQPEGRRTMLGKTII